ncbi:hypothetical protein [uncultured Treponema sp.]|uniref:hypothetical protein n=1 Tax=uncultured Treponema sp. TaxID=162155 RepID=UPI0015BE7468|nr:hypothetical protein [uncultured Treponema sp.]
MENSYLDKVLSAFRHYYTVKTGDDVPAPFVAEAEFISHTEEFFLVKSAKLAEFDCREYVFFVQENQFLSESLLEALAETAWNIGLKKIKPCWGHRNSDVALVVLAQNVDGAALKAVKKLRWHKSYRLGFFGWSNFKLVVKEISSGRVFCNRFGSDLKKILSKINSGGAFLSGERNSK